VIDHKVFAAEMKLLQERFNKPMSDPVFARYFAHVSAHLTTEEFMQAAIGIFNEERFFPAPQDFVDRVKGSLDEQAAREWGELMRAVKAGERSSIGPVARAALEKIGGRWAIDNCDSEKDLGFKRKDFIDEFKSISNPPLGLRDAQQKELPLETARALVEKVSEAAND
jgi:hypothetical protein